MEPTFPEFEPAALPEYALALDVGDPFAPHGLTRLELEGNGAVAATEVLAEDRHAAEIRAERPARSAKGRMDPDTVRFVFQRLHEFPWGRNFPARPGIPDEAIVVWTLKRGGVQRQLKMWIGEAEEDPKIAPVLESLRHTLRRLSDNQMYL